jgi:TRAP-type C4-dicarboxylate transport system substrate-binding protein
MKFNYYFIFIVMAFLSISTVNAIETRELLLIHTGPPGSLYEVSAKEFARRVNERLPSLYKIDVIGDTDLGDGPALLAKLAKEEAMFVLPSAAMTSVSDSFAIFELPFLIRNRAQIRNIRGALLESHLQPEAEHKGLHILGMWESGFRHLTNGQRRVNRPRDLEGLKFAVPANGWREKVLQAFGAEPVPMASRAVRDALRTRIVAGQEAPLVEIHTGKLVELQRHLALSDHLYSPAYLVTRKAAFEGLPETVRGIIAAEAKAMEAWIYDTAVEMESELIDQLDQRMRVTHIDAEAFKAASRPVYGEFVRTVRGGAKMIEIVKALDDVTASGAPGK